MMQIRNGQGQVAYEMAKTPEVAALLDPLRFQTVAQEDEGEFSDDG